MSAPARPSKPLRLDPPPKYPNIILALNLIATTPARFHWIIFVPSRDQKDAVVQEGTKIHAIQVFEPGNPVATWAFESVPFTLMTSASVAAAAIIGQLKDKTVEQLTGILSVIPMQLPAVDAHEPVFSCRVWIREALRRMHGAGFIHCPDVNAMEAEMWEYGRPAAKAVEEDTFKMAKLVTARNSCTL